jgi:hypothetical protein
MTPDDTPRGEGGLGLPLAVVACGGAAVFLGLADWADVIAAVLPALLGAALFVAHARRPGRVHGLAIAGLLLCIAGPVLSVASVLESLD